MNNRTEWITNRKPTREDADANGDVLTIVGPKEWENVFLGEAWIPMPTLPRTLEDVVNDLVKNWKNDVGEMDELEAIEYTRKGYTRKLVLLMNELVKLVEGEQ